MNFLDRITFADGDVGTVKTCSIRILQKGPGVRLARNQYTKCISTRSCVSSSHGSCKTCPTWGLFCLGSPVSLPVATDNITMWNARSFEVCRTVRAGCTLSCMGVASESFLRRVWLLWPIPVVVDDSDEIPLYAQNCTQVVISMVFLFLPYSYYIRSAINSQRS